jgi:hypothetical protein
MRPFARYFMLILCTLALVGGGTVSFAASVAAATPCAHEHSHPADTSPQPHKHHGAGCLACCLGACSAIPDLPHRASVGEVPFAATPVSYWETSSSLSSRSIAPDPAPPRTSI